MIIGFDIDDTISDTYEIMFGYAQKYTIEELDKFDEFNPLLSCGNHNYIEDIHNWNKEETENYFKKYYKKILKEVKPFPFAIETINKLKDKGHKIILITARFDFEDVSAKEITDEWLKKQNICYDKLIVGASRKLNFAIENNLDYFFDDSFENCIEIANNNIKTFIVDSRCNKGLDDSKIKRVYSWPHINYEIWKEINKNETL